MKPNMSKKEDVEEIADISAEKAIKKFLDSPVGTEGKKFSEVLKDIKNKPLEDKDKNDKGHNHEEDIDCPSCKTGHVHKLKEKDGILKCTGPGCDTEYRLMSANPNFQCTTCGTPIEMPKSKELADNYSCPTCGRDSFKEFDKKKIKKIKS